MPHRASDEKTEKLMKKTWTLIALAAALCVSCSDDDKSCTEGAAFCKSGDNNTTVLVTCENGELNETVCNTGYVCDSKKKMCTVAAECSNDMKPSCDQANNRIVYCSNNVITYTDCANGCSVETNKCNPATAGKGVCTAGAKRCNLAGEREICSAAGVWESKPCCAKGDSACLLTCHSGECSSTIKEGMTRCASSSTYQVFESGAWSAAKNCSADKPVCDESKGACITPSVIYCGEEDVELSNGQKMKLQAACDQMNGAGKTIGVCIGDDVNCSKVCQKADVGKTVPVCDIYGTTAGGKAPFAGQAVCTDLYDGTHYGLVEDDSTFKNCKNACNAEGTACDSQGFAEGGSSGGDSSGGGSSSADPYTWCNDEQLKSGGTVGDYCKKNVGENYVGLCNGNNAMCFESCTEAQAGQKKAICETGNGESTSFNLVCKSYGGNYAFGLVGTYTECKGSCDAKKESCDAQGGTAGGSEFGSGSGGGSTDSDGSTYYCGNEKDGEQTLDQACTAEMKADAVALCTEQNGTTYRSCYKTCNASDVNKSVDACYPYNDGNSYKVKDVCTKASDTLYIYVDDSKNATLCSGGCNTEGTGCK